MLSSFEAALLDRHIRGCVSCRSFAVAVAHQTATLRAAELEVPARPVVVPVATRIHRRRAVAALALTACVASLAAALMLVLGGQQTTGASHTMAARGTPVLVSYTATPSLSSPSIEVPRLSVQPASYADGPVRGIFSVPMARVGPASSHVLNN
jgi:predicted anti-sigma-YlaC factor YlaD